MAILDTSGKNYALIKKYARHGGAYDRGCADKWYLRKSNPHFFVGGTYQSQKIELTDMTMEDILAYEQGYADQDPMEFN